MKKILSLVGLFAVVLVVALSWAQVTPQQTNQQTGAVQVGAHIWVEQSGEKNEVIRAGVVVPILNTTNMQPVEIDVLYNEIKTECADYASLGYPDYYACYMNISKRYLSPERYIYKSVKNAAIAFTYYNPIAHTYQAIPGCDSGTRAIPVLLANMEMQKPELITPDASGDAILYYAECKVPESVYRGTRARVLIEYEPPEENGGAVEIDGQRYYISAAPQVVEISDVSVSVFDIVYNTVSGHLQKAARENSFLCLGVFMVLGLLLASMYFAGKSPMSLLDITTPRMPQPKGFVASGQVLLPYGYGEMKRAMKNKSDAAADFLKKTCSTLKEKIGYTTTGQMAAAGIRKLATKMSKEDSVVMEALAYGAAATGQKEALATVLKKPLSAHGEIEAKAVEQILSAMKAKGGREEVMAGYIKDYILTKKALETMDVLSGHPAPGVKSKWHAKLQNGLAKFVGSNRYTVYSTLVMSSYESMVRSSRWLARGTKEMVRQAPTLARGVARTTMELVGGPRALEKLEEKGKVSTLAAWAAKELKKPPVGMPLGQKVAIHEKMSAAYEMIKEEIKRDEIKYVMKQLYKALGVNFALTEEDLLGLCIKDVNILDKSGYSKAAAKIEAIEKELRTILTGKGTLDDKLAALIALAKAHGAVIDTSLFKFNERLNEIDKMYGKEDGYIKYLMLREILAEHEKTVPAAAVNKALITDKFYTVVGRSSICGSDIWETAVLRTLLWDAENGYMKGGLKEALWRTVLEVRNRVTGLIPTSNPNELPEFIRANISELKKIEASNKAMLLALMTDAGKKALAKSINGPAESASVKQIIDMLYGIGRVPKDFEKLKEDRLGRVACFGEPKEVGPAKEWFKLDMKRPWVGELKPAEGYAIAQWVESRFTRSNISPYKASIEAELNRRPGSAKWSVEERTYNAKREWVLEQIRQDCEQRFNSQFAPDAYGKFGERANFYVGILLGFYEKAMKDKGLLENHPDLNRVKAMSTSDVGQLKIFREEIVQKYKKEFMAELKKGVTFDDILTSSRPLVQLYEGDFAYYRKGMPLSIADKVYGDVALRDNKGQWRKFVPEDVVIQFKGRPDLQAEFSKLKEKGPGADWDVFINAVKKWKGENGYDYEREKIFAALVMQHGRSTSDYQKYWRDTALEIKPVREVMEIAPQTFRMLGMNENEKARWLMTAWRNLKTDLGAYAVKTTLMGAGPVFDASYDIVPQTEYLRQHSYRLAANFYTKKWEDWKDMSAAEKSAYRNVVATHFPYHHAWEWCIDRGVRTTASQGLLQVTEHFFHHGPGHLLGGIKEYVRATMTGGEWAGFYALYGWPMDLASKVHKPFVNMFRSFQVAAHGSPSRWDNLADSYEPFRYTEPRLREMMSAPLHLIVGNGKLAKLKTWQTTAEQRHTAGAEIMGGLRQSPSDFFFRRTGVYAYARVGEANPGASYYTHRYELKLDEALASYLWRNRDAAYIADREIQEQAMRSTIRRTVAAEALAMKFDQEIRHFGIAQNPIYGWFNPFMFAWHMPLPAFPTSMTIRDAVGRYAEKRKYGVSASWDVRIADMATQIKDGLWRAATPHKAGSHVWCARCGTPHMRGERCRCGATIYSDKINKHTWAYMAAA